MSAVAVVHLVATLFMAGVIVFVQVVHYPLMGRVGKTEFVRFEAGHTTRTGLVVGPLMLVEMGSALWLVGVPPTPSDASLTWMGLGFLAIIWLSTAAIQAPAHRRLSRGFDEAVHRRLVRTNWIRTVAWLARVPIAVMLVL